MIERFEYKFTPVFFNPQFVRLQDTAVYVTTLRFEMQTIVETTLAGVRFKRPDPKPQLCRPTLTLDDLEPLTTLEPLMMFGR